MQQSIISFYKDELDDWVALLACGHGQHVRHKPPWVNRPWVVVKEEREKRIGESLDCKKCESENANESL